MLDLKLFWQFSSRLANDDQFLEHCALVEFIINKLSFG